jgi:hypothetical protein
MSYQQPIVLRQQYPGEANQTVLYQAPQTQIIRNQVAPYPLVPYQNHQQQVVVQELYENDSVVSDYSTQSDTYYRNYRKLLSGFHPYYDKVSELYFCLYSLPIFLR